MTSIQDLKKDMRRAARAARLDAFNRLGNRASETIAGHGIAFAGKPPPAVVSGFLAIGDEIDPTPLMLRLIGEGYRLSLPV
ncbi:MAG TPA: 5-formyltetrahydrofolate cyclo-ligase, partial [Hyphomicrobium sp.]|nr:5-formyltetrahydrofolate cyclo-ligase [Hyphomicrobium sp.]